MQIKAAQKEQTGKAEQLAAGRLEAAEVGPQPEPARPGPTELLGSENTALGKDQVIF